MNRILSDPESQAKISAPGLDLPAATPGGPRCELFAPVNYEPNYAYPLIVWLHDDGGDEGQLPRLMPHVSLRNFVAAAPRGTFSVLDDQSPASSPSGRAGWNWSRDPDEMHPGELHAAHEAVENCIADAVSCYRIHSDRIFLAGHGAGGTLALRLSLLAPHRFAGGASLLGRFPRGHQPLRHLDGARQQPLLMALGSDGIHYPTAEFCRDLRLFHTAGMRVEVRQYPVEDELTTVMLDDLNRWIMQQVCPPAVSEECQLAADRTSAN